ncbi:EAL domain-containing protein [Amphritea sp. 2_MG-2023]|uniref:EAL domain-containing protein n=1 Tax=Amphritea TaxID=515417 RepID=UPI001C0717C2|nr:MULTISPECIES: EAL domain-containing protein [Amphritea]MBU2966016.1 EAL domain-containing protein [Amphritea atlantica]MDO6418106.1 EAL domain-containing protein [Amphritea sp. 2_MG-2023]
MKYDSTILYIENDDDTRKIYADLFRGIFSTVLEASNGREGISKFITHRPSLVITEIQLPSMNGPELIQEIRKTDSKTPIIVFSAYIDEDFILDTIKDQINGFISKPADNKKLAQVIDQVLSVGKHEESVGKAKILGDSLTGSYDPEEDRAQDPNSLMVVGIGSSAGGLEALTTLIKGLPRNNNTAYIIAQHLSPKHNTMLVELLSRESTLMIKEAEHNETLASDVFYITPPNKNVEINNNNQIILSAPEKHSFLPKPSVNQLFISIAKYKKEKSVGIILSGTGSDGCQGMRAINSEGGITIVQEPSTAKYDGMPMASINGSVVDILIEADKIGEELVALSNFPRNKVLKKHQVTPANDHISIIFALLHKIKHVDFSVYKKATIGRRIERRMVALKVTTLSEYVALIERDEQEVELLYKDILIGVTSFFRDRDAYDSLENLLDKYLDERSDAKELRIWMPGSSTGEEAYSVAIIVNELLNDRQHSLDLKIFATDIDEHALKIARRGIYSQASMTEVSDSYIKDYFTIADNEFEVKKTLRQNIVFSYHNLLSDPPFKDLDLIVCRNLLIYFNLDAQKWIMPAFHYALKENALLFLGKSENATNFEHLFAPVDKPNKIFKTVSYSKKNYSAITVRPPKYVNYPAEEQSKTSEDTPLQETIVTEAAKLLMPNIIVTNEQLDVVYKKGNLDFVSIPEGYVSYNLYKIVDSRLAIDLRKLFSEAKRGSGVNSSSYIPLPQKNGEARLIKVHLVPILNGRNQMYLFYFQSISVLDLPLINSNSNDVVVSSSTHELEFELQRTKEHMQTLVEELETSNEELQSSNEELQSANEELQATNEEMETSNEELQSTNEELQTAYAELKEMFNENTTIKEKHGALNRRYESVLENIHDGVIITNLQGMILKTNHAMQTYTGLTREQLLVKNWFDLYPIEDSTRFLNRQKELTEKGTFGPYIIELTSDEGVTTILNVEDYLSRDELGHTQIWSFASDISKERQALAELSLSQQKYKATFDNANIGIGHVSLDGTWISVNSALSHMLGYTQEELLPLTFQDITYPEDLKQDLELVQELISGKRNSYKMEKRYYKKDGELFWAMLYVAIVRDKNEPLYFISVIEDINSQKQSTLDSAQARMVFNTTQESIVITDKTTRIINVNPAFENITGYTFDEVKGKKIGLLKSDQHSSEFYSEMERSYKQSGFWSGEVINKAKNGDLFPVFLNISAVKDESGYIVQYIGVITDISVIKQSQDKIQYLANHDSLTGLPNRTLLADRLEHALQESRRSKKQIAVLFVDLDRFKVVNDGMGHNVGDSVLIEVSKRLSSVLRSGDTVARVGGDEFIIIIQDLDSALNASKVALNLIQSVKEEITVDEHKITVGASIGISIYPNDGHSADELIRQADIAMYDAKENGRNMYRYISQELSSFAFEKASMESSIREGLSNDQFEVYYQPIIDLETMKVSHLEALIRWNHPKLGLVLPNKFIPLAEESDLITEITKYVVFKVMTTINDLKMINHYKCKIAINFSLKDLESDSLFYTFKNYLQQFKIDGSSISLEITERKVILSNDKNQKHLERYKKLNVAFSMDDFGTGYSNLGYLINKPFDILKIDRSFISRIGEVDKSEEVVKATISIARALGLKTVAEGVETKEQFDFVAKHNCDFVQGFYFKTPEPIGKIVDYLQLDDKRVVED